MMNQPSFVLILAAYLVGAYLLGSIPFSQIITSWRTGANLRETGEGNVGSRNVWHVVGPGWGVLAAVLDILKGYLTYEVGVIAGFALVAVLAGGAAVLVGHQFPLFLRGQGGKGLAAILGILLGLTPLSTLAGLIVLVVAYLAFRDFNPAVTLTAIAMILLPLLFRQPFWVPAYVLGLLLLAGLKKLLDRPHEQAVWASNPWQDRARPGFSRGWRDKAPPSDSPSDSPSE
jgi:glycerol-3-phosphate acyltransferase PlsY